MFNPLFIKTPGGNFVNLALVHTIKKINYENKFFIIFLITRKEDSCRIEFDNEEDRDEFCNRIENLVCNNI